MLRSCLSLAVLVLASACAAERPAREPEVTTTSARIDTLPKSTTPTTALEPPTSQIATEYLEAPTRPTLIEPPSTMTAGLGDSQIVGVTNAANDFEVEQARLALRRATDGRTKDLAQLLYDHHRDAKSRANRLTSSLGLAAAPTATSARLETEGRKALATLEGQSRRIDFDRAYLQVQVRQLRELLDVLDYELIPSVQHADLKKWLLELRPVVAEDFTRVSELQQTLSK